MFKADDYRMKAKALSDSLAETAEALDISEQGGRLTELKAEQEKPEVWQDLERSQKLAREIAAIEGKLHAYEKSKKAIEEVNALIDLIEEMGSGDDTETEFAQRIETVHGLASVSGFANGNPAGNVHKSNCGRGFIDFLSSVSGSLVEILHAIPQQMFVVGLQPAVPQSIHLSFLFKEK